VLLNVEHDHLVVELNVDDQVHGSVVQNVLHMRRRTADLEALRQADAARRSQPSRIGGMSNCYEPAS
jgi:hypothetical protein